MDSLGDRLFTRGLYREAATEYERNIFTGTSADPTLDEIKLGLSLGASGELDRAAERLRGAGERFPEVKHAAGVALAGLFARQHKYDRARLELLDLLIFARDPSERSELNRYIGWLELAEGDLAGAEHSLEQAGLPALAEEVREIAQLPRRSPTLAMAMSSFVPGTGEIYAGRVSTGLLGMAVTGVSAAGVYYAARSDDWVTAAVVFALFFLRFYNGSRRNALDFAEDYNVTQLHVNVDRLVARAKLEPHWFSGAQEVTGLELPSELSGTGLPGTALSPAWAPTPRE